MLYKEVEQLNDAVMDIINQIQMTEDPAEQAILAEKLNAVAEARDAMNDQNNEMLCKARQNCLADNDAIDAEIKRLQARKKANDRAIDWFETKLLEAVQAKGGKFQVGTFVVGTRKSTVVMVDEMVFNDTRFINEVITRKVDKMSLKQALKDGEEVAGASLVDNLNLAIK